MPTSALNTDSVDEARADVGIRPYDGKEYLP